MAHTNKPAATNKNAFQVLTRPLSVASRKEENIPSCLSLEVYFSKTTKGKEGGGGVKSGHRVKSFALVKFQN